MNLRPPGYEGFRRVFPNSFGAIGFRRNHSVVLSFQASTYIFIVSMFSIGSRIWGYHWGYPKRRVVTVKHGRDRHDLAALIARWPSLPVPVRRAILSLLDL